MCNVFFLICTVAARGRIGAGGLMAPSGSPEHLFHGCINVHVHQTTGDGEATAGVDSERRPKALRADARRTPGIVHRVGVKKQRHHAGYEHVTPKNRRRIDRTKIGRDEAWAENVRRVDGDKRHTAAEQVADEQQRRIKQRGRADREHTLFVCFSPGGRTGKTED